MDLLQSINRLKTNLATRITEHNTAVKLREKSLERAANAAVEMDVAERALGVVQATAQATQKEIQYHVGDVVSFGMEGVFDDPYRLAVDFEIRRGNSECVLAFERGDVRITPRDGGGFGAADVGSFSLDVFMLAASVDPVPQVLILDEPFKHLKGETANRRAIKMVKEISERLGIQIIMVADERAPIEEIEDGADRVFRVIRNGSESTIERLK